MADIGQRSADARRTGFGRVLITLYAILALGATARSATQLLSHYSKAPLAYLLSAFAGIVYCIATYALASRRASLWRLAVITVSALISVHCALLRRSVIRHIGAQGRGRRGGRGGAVCDIEPW